MVIVKRLYTFMLQRFLPLFAMTFFITLFIVMMQFLWRYIDDLVGKGLSIDIIGELFFYAALTMVPTALPLAVLMASLMTFGNLGEKFELTAMKAAGISLFRIMRPLIILMIFVAGGAFFFQNDVLPMAQTKMWTLMWSIRQKTPEVEIPERSFYGDLPGMNLYVEHKDRKTGRLDDLIIYDTSRGMDKVRVILADSGRISFTEDKSNICIDLFNGEMYEDFRDNIMGRGTSRYMPFRRETFDRKTAYMAFDANFNRMDDSTMRAQYIGKNISELNVAIDSISARVDSIGNAVGLDIKERPYFGVPYNEVRYVEHEAIKTPRKPVQAKTLNIDSLLHGPRPESYSAYLAGGLAKAQRYKNEFEFRSQAIAKEMKDLRRHEIELHKKFTLSFACIIFFFIGAPLGAIIKKGGLGMPLVISVLLFVVYFIFDNMGYKMARDGKIDVTLGIWLSTMVMFPLGVFFTYKAVGDTTMFDFDMYRRAWRNLRRRLGHHYVDERRYTMKELVIDDIVAETAVEHIRQARTAVDAYAVARGRWLLCPGLFTSIKAHRQMRSVLASMSDYLSNTRSHEVIELLNAIPHFTGLRSIPKIRTILDNLDIFYNKYIEASTDTPDAESSEGLTSNENA